MKRKRKGFTLVELLLVLSIGAVLLTISTNRFILNFAVANNNNNKQIDLQSGVSATMEMVKNTLKKTTQVHLVDKSVYDPELSISQLESRGLDKKYNYIAIQKDPVTGEKTLVNLLYNKTKNGGSGGFEVVPIIAANKGDRVRPVNINFALDLYAGDDDYKTKMKKNIINVKITGTARDVDDAGKFVNPESNKTFSLEEDIFLQNTNQILISRHMKGGLSDVTAIAYDTGLIGKEEVQNVKSMSFVFVIDVSGSMLFKLDSSNWAPTFNLSRKKIARDSIRNFIQKLDAQGKSNDLEINAYIFTYGTNVMQGTPNPTTDGKYIFDLEVLKRDSEEKYGPYILGKSADASHLTEITDHLEGYNRCGLSRVNTRVNSTNTGKALLQALEVLNQLRDKDPTERRFLILLTDGKPQAVYTGMPKRDKTSENTDSYGDKILNRRERHPDQEIINRETYDKITEKTDFIWGDTIYQGREMHEKALLYIKAVTEFSAGNNQADTFNMAYLIAFSGVEEDKKMLGLDGKDLPGYGSIRRFLALEDDSAHQKKNRVKTYDAGTANALDSAFTDITKSIGNVMGIFDGPDKLR